MLTIKTFTFNPYQENTYLLYNESGNAIIIDPGMYGEQDQQELLAFIANNKLKPTLLLNTHCHIDHVLGNSFVHEKFGLLPQFHEGEVPILVAVQNYAPQMGIRYDISPI
ncbi:MAG TPA: MBL fold hydrolase, partial [Sphingobacterium sp.]|nr:MBL fold hydrolase [Sphingobacterium sp.]